MPGSLIFTNFKPFCQVLRPCARPGGGPREGQQPSLASSLPTSSSLPPLPPVLSRTSVFSKAEGGHSFLGPPRVCGTVSLQEQAQDPLLCLSGHCLPLHASCGLPRPPVLCVQPSVTVSCLNWPHSRASGRRGCRGAPSPPCSLTPQFIAH